VLIVGLIGFVM